ncbi:MAG: DoxX family protein [Bacteroidota bacterium]
MNLLTENTAEILILFYITITFAYSAFEKMLQWNDSVAFYRDHFKNTFLQKHIPLSLWIVIILEIITVMVSSIGIFQLIGSGEKQFGLYGLILAAITLIGLMIGQRIAKDYAGAMNISIYFILTVFGVYLLQ